MIKLTADHYDALYLHLVRRLPGLRIRYKNESLWQKILAVLLYPLTPHYMTRCVTTIGHTVWFPSKEYEQADAERSAEALSNCFVAAWDNVHMSAGPELLMPQAIALLTLPTVFAVWHLPMLAMLAFLVALLPWRSPSRLLHLLRCYGMTVAMKEWCRGRVTDGTLNGYGKLLRGRHYYWPASKNDSVERELRHYATWAKFSPSLAQLPDTMEDDLRPFLIVYEFISGVRHAQSAQ